MKDIEQMTEQEAIECKEKIELYLRKLNRTMKIRSLELQIEDLKQENREDDVGIIVGNKEEVEFDYTHR